MLWSRFGKKGPEYNLIIQRPLGALVFELVAPPLEQNVPIV